MQKFTILINGGVVMNGNMEEMRFSSYAAAEMYARLHFAGSPDVFSIIIQSQSKINNHEGFDS